MRFANCYLSIMASNLKPCRLNRSFCMTSRKYSDNKSIYERHEAGIQPRTVHGKLYPEWRQPWIQRSGEWRSKLSLFIEKNPNPQLLNAMQQIPNINIKKIKNWWSEMKVIQEIVNQQYLPERVAILGSNLAAVHFFTYRHCDVKLVNSSEWLKGGDITKLNFPSVYTHGYEVEAIDCTNFHHNGIRFEGLQNLTGLNFLKWLSLKNNRHVDLWCLDRIAGQNGISLEHLDISGCQLCVGGVFALARMTALRMLIITDPEDIKVQAALSMLEDFRPKLIIKAIALVPEATKESNKSMKNG